MEFLKNASPSNSFGLWLLSALFVINLYTVVQIPTGNTSSGAIVLASAE